MALEIEKMLVMSTAHISRMTIASIEMETADAPLPWAPAFTRNEGYMFWVEQAAEHAGDFVGTPADLLALLTFAREQGCAWLMLDADGPTVDGLKIFDW